jgi:diguanylate cyclase (GGDEF)-like protein/PAS domain S-box-containing protein
MNSAAPARIMIVDDETAHQRALCDSLRDRGYETAGFGSGKAALAALREQQFDLLLTDLMMPGMDGVTLLVEALKLDPRIAGILMTGMGTIETAVQAMQAGAQDYILKPFKVSTLLPVVTRALNVRELKLENLELKSTVAIHELNQALAHTLDPNELLDKIADAAIAQFDADEASVMLADEDGNNLLIAAVRGAGREALLGTRIPVGAGIAGWVAAHHDPQILEGDVTDARLKPTYPRKDIQSALSIPMMSRNKLIGVLNINCLRHRGAFVAGQIKALSIFTNAAAAALEAARLHDAQRKADGRYREVLDMVADAIVSCDEELRIVVFNDAAEAIFGHAADDLLGQPLDVLLPDGIRQQHRGFVRNFGLGPEKMRAVNAPRSLYGRRRDGTLFPIEAGISKRLENGKALYTAVVRDITQRLQQEERIARLTRLYAILSGINATIVRVKDEAAIYSEICRIATDKGEFNGALVGVLDDKTATMEIVASSGFDPATRSLPIPGEIPGDTGSLARSIRQNAVTWNNDIAACADIDPGYSRLLGLDARSVAYLPFVAGDAVRAVMLIYASEPGAFGEEEFLLLRELAGDVSFALDHIAKTQHLEFLASHDPLTGLPNRALFMDRLAQAASASLERAAPLAVMLVDIDRFRLINDTFGRQGGDMLLRQLTERFRASIPERANLARVGPDIFATTHQSFTQASEIARSVGAGMDKVFSEPFIFDGQPVHLAARVGIAFFPTDGKDADTLIKNAEAALDRAKSRNEKMVMYTADLNARVAERLALESKLRGALERGEFLLHYQPKVDLGSGQVVGMEALLRWQDPETGLVPPDEFIGLLEEMGLILQVGSWVMQEATRTAAALRARGMNVRIAVNVSPLQLRDANFVDTVAAAIAAGGKAPHGLDLEITESLIMHDISANARKLDEVRKMRVGLAIDDFGTGYSSLAYIARLPVEMIKIDRAFIRNLETDSDSAAIVQTIISLTHALKMKVIAEGVETEAQARILRRLRCDYYQGYLYSRPLPLAAIEQLLLQPPVKAMPAAKRRSSSHRKHL